MRLLLKFATRSRPDKFRAAMQNIYDTIRTDNYFIIVSIDNDDESMLKVSEEPFKNTTFYINPPGGKIAAINANVPLTGWDWLLNMSDDMRFVQQGWDATMLDRIKSVWPNTTDFFANFNDGFQGPKLCTMSVIGFEYYCRSFYIYKPCYKSLSCDAEEYYVAQVLGRYHYFPDTLYSHDHPCNIRQKSDALYIENEKHAKPDADIYFKRLNKDFYIHNAGKTPFDRFKGKR